MATFRFKLVKEKTNVDFMKFHKLFLALSAAMMICTVALLFTRGLNFGIDFTGGVLMEISKPEGMQIGDIRARLGTLSAGMPTMQEFGAEEVLIKIPGKEASANMQKALREEVKGLLKIDDTQVRRMEYVGPQVGRELILTGVKAFVYSMICIMLFIWVRYEWQFGATGVFSLAHDVCATLLFFILTGMEFDLSTVAAILLVAGYSINDTVVVFDRIREVLRRYRKTPLPELFNMAVNDMLSRTLMTSFLTLLALGALALFGSEVIKGFTYALIVGVVVGTYSSVYIAAPLLIYLKIRPVADTPEADAPKAEKKTDGRMIGQGY